ncbi:MAG: hypothetical protein H6544_05980 [Prevotellaceae bacterium]|nr:hypothetical protein [Prevotellaceae bacterium]
MSNLYIFGIGGTGSRVLRSLTMLMASGVKLNGFNVVPIVIDPDAANADLTRNIKSMRDYKNIRNKMQFTTNSENTFFDSDINMDIIPNVIMPLNNTQNQTFGQYIDIATMKDGNGNYDSNYALASMLFSEHNLKSGMEVGFKGNPNIGSVVLNQFANSVDFQNFAASFTQGDRIFIISSIFGGTGASGFPLLLKNLRAIANTVSGSGVVANAPIGAISVLPYFDVAPDPNQKSEIDSSTFVSKAKAALSYYDRNMTETNILYYVADNVKKQYNNSDGGTEQKNDAHFIELIAALAIVDFANLQNDNSCLQTLNQKPQNQYFKEFGIKNDSQQIIFSDLCANTNNIIQKPLVRFTLFCKYLKEQISDSRKQAWSIDNKFDDNFYNQTFFNTYLSDFVNDYMLWLQEMGSNNCAFCPFELDEKKNNLFSLVKGVKPAKVMSFDSNYALFDGYLNSVQKSLNKGTNHEHLFMEMFYKATEKIIENKIKL